MDPASILLKQLKERGIDQIDEWVKDGWREDLHLDFKRKSRPTSSNLSDDDRRNFSKSLSGFANSDSGLVVWGIGAPGSGNSIRTKHPIRPVNAFAENLDSQISRLVNPSVQGVENFVIYEDQSKKSGYVVSYIPRSDRSPHRAECEGLKQYYKRIGESFKIAEHYELEYMFGKRQHPDLGFIWSVVFVGDPEEGVDPIKAKIRLGVTNYGKAIAHHVCLRLRYHNKGRYPLDYGDRSDLIHFSKPTKASRADFQLVTARALLGLVVYPGDYTYFFDFPFELTWNELASGKVPKFEVYYDLFASEFEGLVNEKFVVRGKKICEKLKKRLEG